MNGTPKNFDKFASKRIGRFTVPASLLGTEDAGLVFALLRFVPVMVMHDIRAETFNYFGMSFRFDNYPGALMLATAQWPPYDIYLHTEPDPITGRAHLASLTVKRKGMS